MRDKSEKGKRQWQENRWDTSATWWRVRFPVSESTEASSRSMYISRSPQSWSLPDSLSRLRIILTKITVWSPCNKPSFDLFVSKPSITCAAGNVLPTQTSSGSSYPFRNHKRKQMCEFVMRRRRKWLKKLISLVYIKLTVLYPRSLSVKNTRIKLYHA